MKKVIRASTNSPKAQKRYTLGDFVLLLKQIEELQGLDISMSGNPSTGTQLTVGDYIYTIEDGFTSYPAAALD